ncbi:DUF1990 family protein [Nocardioides humi]|uniref:DUF1990 domain-containing protein n=1 Tax=Nocardioides humi TaxID=449461 RepID=A0ABN2B8Z3_9ACTN|nr:DUF1990 domain-containing protein [Nocardioides humi]
MRITTLDPARAARLGAAELTYRPAGGTPHPRPGYDAFSRSRRLGRRDLEGAAAELLGWEVHARAGLAVAASAPRAEVGVVVEMRLGVGPLGIRIPCRVVRVVDEPDRRGFAYGTLPGHPEAGEELFVIERGSDGALTFTVAAFSRPASLLARAGGPLTRWVQAAMTGRYLRALDAP